MIVLGLSSGTSTDGIDVAAARLTLAEDLVRLAPLGHFTVPYSDELKGRIHTALPPARTTLEAICRIDTGIGQEFAEAARIGIAELTDGHVDLIASHGQTLFHWVEGTNVRGTLQLGQPAWIAEATGLPVVSDLRVADVAAGGQGAPLAALMDVLLLGDLKTPAAALNLGGIANVTVVHGNAPPEAFDTGPANTLLDTATRMVTEGRRDFDVDGVLARAGRPDPALLEHLLTEPYYRLPPPRTTGPELFGPEYLDRALQHVGRPSNEDLLATLTELTAVTVADALRPHSPTRVLASGGGVHNPALMERLTNHLAPAPLHTSADLGMDPDAKEAYLFALIGFLSRYGLAGSLPACTGARRAPVAGRLTPGTEPLRPITPATTRPRRLIIEPPNP